MSNDRPHVGIGVLIVHENKILLGKRKNAQKVVRCEKFLKKQIWPSRIFQKSFTKTRGISSMKNPFIHTQDVSLFFGDAAHCPSDFNDTNLFPIPNPDGDQKILTDFCEQFIQDQNISKLVVLQQVHGVDSLVVGKNTLHKKEKQVNYRFTNKPLPRTNLKQWTI